MRVQSVLRGAGLCLAIAVLPSCSDTDSSETSQVIARVGKTELTAAQFDARLRRLPPNADKRDPQVLKLMLKNFIDETLLAQAAEDEDLDKRPSDARDIENSRNVVLANAYIGRTINPNPPSEAAIQRYYNDNPALFANRRIYRLTDVTVRESQPGAATVVAEMKRPGATTASIVAIAQQNKVALDNTSGLDSGENLPSRLAQGLARMEASDAVVYRIAETQHFTRIDAISDAPLSYAAAHDAIGDILLNQARQAAANAKLAQLRGATTVEYGAIGREIEAGRGAGAARSAKGGAGGNATRNKAIAGGAEGL